MHPLSKVKGRLRYCSHSGCSRVWQGAFVLHCTHAHLSTYNFPWNPETQKEGSLDRARWGAKGQDTIIQIYLVLNPSSATYYLCDLGQVTKPKSQFPHQWNGISHPQDEGNNSNKSKHYAKSLAQKKKPVNVYHFPHYHHYYTTPQGSDLML